MGTELRRDMPNFQCHLNTVSLVEGASQQEFTNVLRIRTHPPLPWTSNQ